MFREGPGSHTHGFESRNPLILDCGLNSVVIRGERVFSVHAKLAEGDIALPAVLRTADRSLYRAGDMAKNRANLIRALRETKHPSWRQDDLAVLVGCSGADIGKYERGDRMPALPTALRIAAALNQPVEAIFWGYRNQALGDVLDHRIQASASNAASTCFPGETTSTVEGDSAPLSRLPDATDSPHATRAGV